MKKFTCPPAGGVSQERQRKIDPRGPDVSAGEGREVASMSAAEIEDSISRLDAKPLGGEGSLRLSLLIASRRVEGSVVFVEVLAIPVGIGRFHFCILPLLPLVTSPHCRRLSRGRPDLKRVTEVS